MNQEDTSEWWKNHLEEIRKEKKRCGPINVQPIVDDLITVGIWPSDVREGAGIVRRLYESSKSSWGAKDDHENLKKIFFKVYKIEYDEVENP